MRLILSLILVPFLWSGALMAGDRPVVVELFTSQGCSSCPPADKLLHKLAARDDVVALALHVDYWDYIGWKDSFADPAYTKRQYAYARAGDRRMVYTPQMIINGLDHVVGNRPKDVGDLIARHKQAPEKVAITLRRKGNQMEISAEAVVNLGAPLRVQVVQYVPNRTIAITRGENAGRILSYVNVVTDWIDLGAWNPAQPFTRRMRVKGDQPVVVIVQRPGHGVIEGVAVMR